MKFIASTKDFKNAVKNTALAVADNKNTSVLSGVLIRTFDYAILLEGTNLANSIQVKIPAEIDDAGSCIILASTLKDIADKLPGSVVTVEVNNSRAVLTSNDTRFEIFTLETEAFPNFSIGETKGKFNLSVSAARAFIKQTIFACADEKDSLPVFQGVSFNFDGGELTALGTNTHRIARKILCINQTPSEPSIIIPGKTLKNLNIVLPESGSVDAEFNDRAIKFTCENVAVFSRLIDGAFPSVDKLFNIDAQYTVIIDKTPFLQALERVNLIARNNEWNTVHLKFNDTGLDIASESYATGSATEHIDLEFKGEFEIALNIRYLIEFLKAIEGDSVTCELPENSISPMKLVDNHFKNFDYVITPIRT